MDKSDLLRMAKRVFPKPAKTREEVEAAASQAGGLESLRPRGGMAMAAAPPLDVVGERLRDGGAALDKMKKGKTDLTPNEQLGLEAIVFLFGRPALLVQDDDFAAPPEEWKHLEDKRTLLKGILPSVGRVDLANHHTFPWCGTAFLIGEGILMTNRHVASIFAAFDGRAWKFTPGVKANVDYREEHERDKPNEFKIDKVLGVHSKYDLALLSVSMKSGRKKAPAVLKLSSAAPRVTKDADVAVIGYPAFDSRNGRTEQMEIFKNIFNVKRLQPGKTMGMSQTPQVLGHDASTLGGNSGSCVVDLETGNVIALHFGGTYMKGNVSVPLWKLAKDPLFKKFKVNWA
jgi:V8-like Glu-specific endopeptidase